MDSDYVRQQVRLHGGGDASAQDNRSGIRAAALRKNSGAKRQMGSMLGYAHRRQREHARRFRCQLQYWRVEGEAIRVFQAAPYWILSELCLK